MVSRIRPTATWKWMSMMPSVSFERDVAANLGVRLTALSSHHRDNDRQANLLRPYDSYSKRTVLNLEIDGHDVIAEVDAEPRDVDVTIVLLVGLELGTVRKRNCKARVVRTW